MSGLAATSAAAGVLPDHTQLLACQLSSWYPTLASHALRSAFVDLPEAFVNYLDADGVFLPEASAALPQRGKVEQYPDEDDYQDWDDTSASASDSDAAADEGQDWTELCPSLEKEISTAIEEMGGVVVPKMNWSCPSDATWLSPFSNMQCSNDEQVVLLLKSSDRVSHDLATISALPAALRPQPRLALRKWYDLRPEREFRCFIRQRQLVAISQRDPTQYFPQLQGEMAAISNSISSFVQRTVLPAFPLDSYTCDVYCASSGTVKIVDFNPVGGTTSALLFDWEELYSPDAALPEQQRDAFSSEGQAQQQQVVVRIVEDASKLAAGQRTAVAMPYDMLGLANTVDDIMQQMQQGQPDSS